MKHYKVAAFLTFVAVATILLPETSALCNVCGSNGIRCISETEFQFCTNGQPDTTDTFTCPTGVCSSLQMKCIEGATPDCAQATCGCDGSRMFACTSRTTFAQCNGNTIIKEGTCPSGLSCSTTNSKTTDICVDECKLGGAYECDRETPATPV